MDGWTDAHSWRDVADMGLQPEGQSRPLEAERRAGDKQQGGLHGLHDGAAVQDADFSAPAGKKAQNDASLLLLSPNKGLSTQLSQKSVLFEYTPPADNDSADFSCAFSSSFFFFFFKG